MSALEPLVGSWEVTVDLPGAEDARGRVVYEWLGQLLVGRSEVPDTEIPDSLMVIAPQQAGGFLQHYFDQRGVVRLYTMTLEDDIWTLLRTTADFSPLAFHQRYVGRIGAGRIEGEWQASDDGRSWQRDFGIVHRRLP